MMVTNTQQTASLERNNSKINPELLVLDKKNENENKDIIANTVRKIKLAEALAD